jgi:hypothetical protein
MWCTALEAALARLYTYTWAQGMLYQSCAVLVRPGSNREGLLDVINSTSTIGKDKEGMAEKRARSDGGK